MEPWELGVREAIREAIARYAHLVDRGRIDDVLVLFAADGTLEANDLPPARGHDAIRAFLTGAGARLADASASRLVRHHVSTVTIDLTGLETATAASYFFVVTERGPDHWGRYRDRLIEHDGRWLFHHRRVRTDGYAPGSLFARG
jgi:hypothetical protein